jgi:hypothetical protein
MAITPLFQGEVLMRRWSDSSTQGVQVTFALADADDLEPLKAKAGKRFMCVLVEIGDDEQAVQPVKRTDTRGPLCREACDYCALPDFHRFVAYAMSKPVPDQLAEPICKMFILKESGGIESRKDLDADQIAGELFIERVRVPFMKWQRQQRKVAA